MFQYHHLSPRLHPGLHFSNCLHACFQGGIKSLRHESRVWFARRFYKPHCWTGRYHHTGHTFLCVKERVPSYRLWRWGSQTLLLPLKSLSKSCKAVFVRSLLTWLTDTRLGGLPRLLLAGLKIKVGGSSGKK